MKDKEKGFSNNTTTIIGGMVKESSFSQWDMIEFANYCQNVEPYSVSGLTKLKNWMELKQNDTKQNEG